ncbi:MAG: methyltransferase [Dehalococcoidia bacterium]
MAQTEELPPSPELIIQITQLLVGNMAARIVSTAALLELDLHLRHGPRTAADLAQVTETDPETLGRFLRAVAAVGVIIEHEDGRFSLTPLGKHLRFARIGMLGEDAHRAWNELPYTLRTSRPAWDHIFGTPFYDHLAERPVVEANFNEWLAVTAGPWLSLSVAACDLTSAGTVVDVGGGDGTFLAALLNANPQLHGTVIDLPDTVGRAFATFERAGVADRSTVVAGSFFDAIPVGGDVYTVCRVLFNWDDDHAIKILSNIRRAMSNGARLLVIEVPLPPLGHAQRLMGTINDLNLLLLMGGRYRSIEELRALLQKAGFELTSATPANDGWYVIEAHPLKAQEGGPDIPTD